MKEKSNFLLKIQSYYQKLLLSDNSIILHSFSHLYFKNLHPNFIDSTKVFKKNEFNFVLKFKFFLKKFILFDKMQQKIDCKKTEIIILSHKLSINKNKDIYFQGLKKIINKKFINIFINHTHAPSKNIKIKKNTILLSKKLNFFIEFLLLLKVIFFSMRNPKIFKYHSGLLSKIEIINQSIYNLRIYNQLKKIMIKYKPKSILFTYEGYAYERLICKLSNELNIRSCGYQTSVIIPSSNSVFQSYLEEYDPNVIFTSNKYYQDLFKKKSKFKNTKILCLGREAVKKVNYSEFSSKKNILVLPEGILSECLYLFSSSYKVALKNRNLNFIWRIHPVLDWKEILQSLNIKNLPSNIKISKDTLINDIKKSKFCLYRGSGAIVEALRNSVIPIYLKNTNDLETIDPLFKYNKNIIKSDKDLLKFINKYKNKEKHMSQIKKFEKFLNNFYQEITSDLFKYI